MIRISVIMPLYNAEKFLRESLDSVLNQTFDEFELICVDDASTDKTMSILEEYHKLDKRVTILSNVIRQGAAYSRNCGIKQAKGKYMIFLDGDDIFDEEMLEVAYQTIEKHSADVVIFGYEHVASEDIYIKRNLVCGNLFINKYCKETFSIDELKPYEWVEWNSAPWNKMFYSDFIKRNNLKFQSLMSSNDVYFINMALLMAAKIIILNDNRVMVYARNHSEPSRISNQRDPMCVYNAIAYMQEELLKKTMFSKCFQHFYYRAFFMLKDTIGGIVESDSAEQFYDFLKKEGINQLRSKDTFYYKKLDEDIKNCIEKFQSDSYETKWFTRENQLDFYLRDNKKSVLELFRSYLTVGKTLAIWGAGKNGYSLLKLCEDNQLKITAVIDVDKNKQGMKIFSYTIHSFEEIQGKIQVIIVSALHSYQNVLKIVGERNIEVVDINVFLGIS